MIYYKTIVKGSGCVTTSRLVTYNTRDLQLEYCHRQFVITVNCVKKTKNEREAVVVAKLVEQLLPTPEINGANPVINIKL